MVINVIDIINTDTSLVSARLKTSKVHAIIFTKSVDSKYCVIPAPIRPEVEAEL